MNVCVFLGPTLPVEEAARILDAVYLPPAAQGDVLMATDDGADVIGIVDGYFQGAPSVWHKEILWAMSRGVRVLGSSSMGALRAAELAEGRVSALAPLTPEQRAWWLATQQQLIEDLADFCDPEDGALARVRGWRASPSTG